MALFKARCCLFCCLVVFGGAPTPFDGSTTVGHPQSTKTMTDTPTTNLETSTTSSSSGENFSMPPPASSAVADDDDDSLYCILSNILFISGGIFYITASSWDYSLYAYSPENVDITIILTHFTYLLYQTLWIMGPLVYFLNSIVDIKWALRTKRRYRKRRDAEKLANPSLAGIKESNILKEIYRQIRKNVGSRRTLGAATTFGLGAFCGLVGALLSTRAANTTLGSDVADTLYTQADKAGSASVHIYLLSAIVVLWKPTKAWKNAVTALWNKDGIKWYNDPTSLFTLGDILFGIAAINDTILTDTTLDDGYYSLPILSAILWTTDALLYTRGDICVYRLQAAGVDTTSLSSTLGNDNDGSSDDVQLSPSPPPPVVVDPENEIV
jgi:hypothetical protein